MSDIKIIDATSEILERFYGKRQTQTVRAIAAVDGEQVLAIAGYVVGPESVAVFSEIKPEAMCQKKMIVKGTRRILKMAKDTGLPVYTSPDPRFSDKASRFLERFGFQHIKNGIYKCLS